MLFSADGGFVLFGCSSVPSALIKDQRGAGLSPPEPGEWSCLVTCISTGGASAWICTEGLINGSAS